jgi:acetyl-CoA acetyltransferase
VTSPFGRTAILGVGASSFERDPERSVLQMAGDALRGALRDAGLEPAALDGLIVQVGSPRGADYDTVAETFGLSPKFCSQTWAHGRFTATVILQAAMAVSSGLARRVACLMAMKNSDLGRLGEADNPFYHEQFRENGGPHGEEGWIGMASPVAGAAMAFDYYCRRYDQDREALAAIPIAFRAHAACNPDAVHRTPLNLADYQASRAIVEPLRLFDCSPVGDGAVCLIVGRLADASAAERPGIVLTGGQGLQAGRERFIFGPCGLGLNQQSGDRPTLAAARAQTIWRTAGTQPEAIQTLGVYDSFSPLPIYALEDFGFCAAGEGLDFVQDGRLGLGGVLPTNTAGGQLSEAQLNGWGQLRELVRQLRGEAGPRQVPEARRAMWIGVGGDALVFERG